MEKDNKRSKILESKFVFNDRTAKHKEINDLSIQLKTLSNYFDNQNFKITDIKNESRKVEKDELLELIELAELLNKQIKEIEDLQSSIKYRLVIMTSILYFFCIAIFLIAKKAFFNDESIQLAVAVSSVVLILMFMNITTKHFRQRRDLRDRLSVLKKSSNELNDRAYKVFELIEERMSTIERESLRIRLNLLNMFSAR